MSSEEMGDFAGSSVNSSRDTFKFPNRNHLPSLYDPDTQRVFQVVINSRKNWKTVRGGEIVWPPELEAALVEGLHRYKPNDSIETRILGRYPRRNRFLSEYIFRKTGMKRTAKQVGSRLQQLRDTVTEERFLKLLSPCAPTVASWRARSLSDPSDRDTSESASDITNSPVTPVDAHFPEFSEGLRNVIVIDILHDPTCKNPVPNISDEDCSGSNLEDNIFRPTTSQPRPLHSIDPTVTFVGPSKLCAGSSFSVHVRGVIVFEETTCLTCLGSVPGGPEDDDARLYSTTLVPGFWDRILESADPTQYSILQDVVRGAGPGSPTTIFSAVYKFKCHSGPSEEPSRISAPSTPPQCDETIFDILSSPASLDSLRVITLDPMPPDPSPDTTSSGNMFNLKCESPDQSQWYDFLNPDPKMWDMNSPSPFLMDYTLYRDHPQVPDGSISPFSLSPSPDAYHSNFVCY